MRVTAEERFKNGAIDRLASRGYVTIGQPVSGVVWAGQARPDLRIDASAYMLKLTNRGYELVAAMTAKPKPQPDMIEHTKQLTDRSK